MTSKALGLFLWSCPQAAGRQSSRPTEVAVACQHSADRELQTNCCCSGPRGVVNQLAETSCKRVHAIDCRNIFSRLITRMRPTGHNCRPSQVALPAQHQAQLPRVRRENCLHGSSQHKQVRINAPAHATHRRAKWYIGHSRITTCNRQNNVQVRAAPPAIMQWSCS